MKGYYIEGAIIQEPTDFGFPDRWDGYVLCNDNDTVEDGLFKKFGVNRIYALGDVDERPADTIPASELTVGELRIVMSQILKG